ncbi:MAG: lytic murein transglycosylase B [Cycloclasticus sp. symbiont of Bathymodiolus heckerae]|nr:MAG: lytic murein transglycosylase B [Cycloclasticus sp. symbiont of Bathymodiolus heckerae]
MQLNFIRLLLATLITFTSLSACATKPSAKPDIYHDFIEKMVSEHQFDRDELSALLNKAVVKESILKAMSSPAERRLEWHSYRRIFLKPNRINGGIKFWAENKALLDAASKKYGVPAEIIVAIIGVETRYGGNTGSYKVLDSLTTLGFHFPKRAKFFKSELEHFLLLCREEGFDPYEPKGSYAGAMGKSQFISSSYRAYAVDGDGDNKRDLWNSHADIINSVAHYFAKHGWKNSTLVTQQTTVKGDTHKSLLSRSLKPKNTLKQLAQKQVKTPADIPDDTIVKLLKLNQKDHSEYWLTFHNFYVITRYNHSHLYAMAVYQLGQEIKKGFLESNK